MNRLSNATVFKFYRWRIAMRCTSYFVPLIIQNELDGTSHIKCESVQLQDIDNRWLYNGQVS